MIKLAKKLWPINRSLTGEGVRKTLKLIKKENRNLKIKSIKSGTKIFDWKIPSEWKINNAWIKNKNKKIIDFKENNLHVIGYSKSVNKVIDYKNLVKKLHSLPSQKNAIPYVTSYYKRDWGFCCTENFKKNLDKRAKYKVFIDSNFKKRGKLNYGEIFFPGKQNEEILFVTNICHPSLANNELSGICLLSEISKYLKKLKKNFSYRILFIPETIGAIAFIKQNFNHLKKNTLAGFITVCVGDKGNFSYIPSRYGNNLADKSIKSVLKKNNIKYKKYSWLDRGSDERQFASPYIDLPIASLTRTKYGEYKEYHTSLDKLGTVVTEKNLLKSFKVYKKIIDYFEKRKFPKTKFYGEPMLSKRKLYNNLSIKNDYNKKKYKVSNDILNFLSYSDGQNSLNEIEKLIGLNKNQVNAIYQICKKNSLVS